MSRELVALELTRIHFASYHSVGVSEVVEAYLKILDKLKKEAAK